MHWIKKRKDISNQYGQDILIREASFSFKILVVSSYRIGAFLRLKSNEEEMAIFTCQINLCLL